MLGMILASRHCRLADVRGERILWALPFLKVGGRLYTASPRIHNNDRREYSQTARHVEIATVPEILRSLLVYKACSIKWLPRWTMRALSVARAVKCQKLPLEIIRRTIFKQFCGGETVEEVGRVAQALQEENIAVILDYAAEPDLGSSGSYEELPPCYFDFVADNVHRSIELAKNLPGAMVAIKVSGLFPPHYLYNLNLALVANSNMKLESLEGDANFKTSWPRLVKILDHARDLGVVLAIDAEQSFLQHAINMLALQVMERYNSIKSARRLVVMNTYQMYRKDALDQLSADIRRAETEGFHFGAKIVRGAYVSQERALSVSRKSSCPIFDEESQTHAQYDAAVNLIFSHLRQDCRKDLQYNFCFATHNAASVGLVEKLLTASPLVDGPAAKHHSMDNAEISIAQLYGMSDCLSFGLAGRGLKVYKYVPFGPVKHVIPYLLRRAEENSSIFKLSNSDARMYLAELKKRISAKMSL